MSINDVQDEWPMCQLLMNAMYVGINTPDVMDMAVAHIGSLPPDPEEWDDWLHGLALYVALHNAVQVTDAALLQEQKFIVATNIAASLITVSAPSEQQVSALLSQMQVINSFIQNDQRFHEALKIGKALAAGMGTMLSKPAAKKK